MFKFQYFNYLYLQSKRFESSDQCFVIDKSEEGKMTDIRPEETLVLPEQEVISGIVAGSVDKGVEICH